MKVDRVNLFAAAVFFMETLRASDGWWFAFGTICFALALTFSFDKKELFVIWKMKDPDV